MGCELSCRNIPSTKQQQEHLCLYQTAELRFASKTFVIDHLISEPDLVRVGQHPYNLGQFYQ